MNENLEHDVDFDSDGVQHGWLATAKTPGTLDRQRLPLTVLRRGAGPRCLLIGNDQAGSGALALRRLARSIDPCALDGTVVIVPEAPSTVRDSIVHRLVDEFDTVLELNDAPRAIGFSPMAACMTDANGRTPERSEAAMVAFGAPESVRFVPGLATELPGGSLPPHIAHVRTTLDGSVSIAEAIEIAVVGCRNVLAANGTLDTPFLLRASRTLAVRNAAACVVAASGGLLELRVQAGRTVYRGDPIALIVDPTRNGIEPEIVRVPHDGVVLAARTETSALPGDCLAVVAEEMPR